MMNKLSTILLRLAGWLLVMCVTASMFMCGDAECLTGDGDENCASLLCALLSKHGAASQNATNGADQDCSCVCHVPTVVGAIFNFAYHPIAQYNVAAVVLQIFSTPPPLVYHPPATA